MTRKNFSLYVFLLLIILIILISFKVVQNNQASDKVCFKDYCFYVELADNQIKREQGLMFRESMDSDKGMFFVFKDEGIYSFWMKNTLFPLDIIWINKDKEIVFIKKNAQPCEKESCLPVNPGKEAKYVLEINAGMADKVNIKTGDKLIFNVNKLPL